MTSLQPEAAQQPLRTLMSHALRVRRLHLLRITALTPRLTRVTLGGPDLEGFLSLAPDDHVKVLFPGPGQDEPAFPRVERGQVLWASGEQRAIARDYTPTRFDARLQELDLEIVRHPRGHASAWLERPAAPGAVLGVAGPRGSHVFTRTPSPLLMAGDETALPAMARWLRELPEGARAFVYVEVDDARDEIALESRARVTTRWLHRGRAEPGSTQLLLDAVRSTELPALTYAFLAGEASAVQALRRHLSEERGVAKDAIGARGYWKRGAQDHQEPHDD